MTIVRAVGGSGALAISAANPVYGLPPSGSSTDAAPALSAALSAAAAVGRDLDLPAGTYKVNSGLTWSALKHSVRGRGDVFLDFSGMTSGTALSVTGAAGATGLTAGLNPTQHMLEGVTLLGPDTDAATVDGVLLSDTSGAPMVALRSVRVRGFRDNLKFGNNVWLAKFHDCAFANAHRYGMDLTPGTNSGENFSFFGCVISNTHNSGNTGIGVYATGNPDAYFYGCSFDYNDVEIHHKGGKISLSGGHIENGKASAGSYVGNPMVKLTRVAGQSRTVMTMTGVEVSPTEGANSTGTARDHLVEVTSDSSNDAYLTCTGVVWDTYDGSHTVFKNLSSSTVYFHNRGGMWDNNSADGTRSATLGVFSSALVNGDCETASTFPGATTGPYYPGKGWGVAGSANTTWAYDTTNQRSGTRCISVIGASGNTSNTACANAFPVDPGRMLQFTGWVRIPSYTSGTLSFRVHWYYDDFTTRQVVAFQRDFTATQSTYTPVTSRLIVPPGIRVGLLDLQQNAFIGTAYLDDVTAHIT